MVLMAPSELHRGSRAGWLRAAVLGANDGILSTASLMVGVSAASAGYRELLLAGVAGLVSGAMAMAAGEYVSVSSQADIELADLTIERAELVTRPERELQELASIYVTRGLTPELAVQVARQLTAHDALGAHARDELGMSTSTKARPVQASLASAVSFALGAVLPLLAALVAPAPHVALFVAGTSLAFLAGLGAMAASAGGAPMLPGSVRVALLGALAMGLTATVGKLFGTVVM